MSRRTLYACLALLLVAPAITAALWHRRTSEAQEAVLRAATAHERVGYWGQASWRKEKWSRRVDIRHDARTGATHYRWNGKPYVLSRPSSRSSDPAAWCLDAEAVEQNYRARLTGTGRYLGRPTRHLVLEPRHDGRPTVHLDIDRATDLPLKVTTIRPDGSLYRVCAFRKLEIGPQDVTAPQRSGRRSWRGRSVSPTELPYEAGFRPLLPDHLPEGFRLRSCRVVDWMGGSVRVSYTDGVTVFELHEYRVLTPAELEHMLTRKMGARRARHRLRRIAEMQWRRLIRDESVGGGVTVGRHRRSRHTTYRLRVDDVEVTLSARSDLAEAEVLNVIRSLRPVD